MNKFLNFMREAVSKYHAVNYYVNDLETNGFKRLSENKTWRLEFNKKYYVVRNDSSIIAFKTPKEKVFTGINITASHTDSPTFKIKPNHLLNDGSYLRLNTEVYGGPIISTWLDRPLSIAGKVILEDGGKLLSKLVYIDKDLLVIPNMAPHLKPEINNGYKYNLQLDMMPLFGQASDNYNLNVILAKELMVSQNDIKSFDLYLVNRIRARQFGYNDDLILSPQLDDLASSYASYIAFRNQDNKAFNVFASFDNEEVGSMTRQGADSNFLEVVLKRAYQALGYKEEEYLISLANSIMLSIDNAHALNPNNKASYDELNRPILNKGVVIKYNANERYTTNSLTSAYLNKLAKEENINLQAYTNRSDIRGGSTLGAILLSHLSINSCDIGLPQLMMHSSTELCGLKDINDLVKLVTKFYSCATLIENDNALTSRD